MPPSGPRSGSLQSNGAGRKRGEGNYFVEGRDKGKQERGRENGEERKGKDWGSPPRYIRQWVKGAKFDI